MNNEPLEEKLRNQLSPIYALADMVLAMDKHPEIKNLVIKQATQVSKNRPIIDLILQGIELKTLNKPDVMRQAFEAGQTTTLNKNEEVVDFDDWLRNFKNDI